MSRPTAPDSSSQLSKLTRCLEPMPRSEEEGRLRDLEAQTGEVNQSNMEQLQTPYVVHFACNTKPWLQGNQGLFFARKWLSHLALVEERMAAVRQLAEGRQLSDGGDPDWNSMEGRA